MVSESILGETDVKKRALLVKFFIKLADVGPVVSDCAFLTVNQESFHSSVVRP